MRQPHSPPRHIDVEQHGEAVVLRVQGPRLVDEADVRLVAAKLDRWFGELGCRRFVVNLAPVREMTSQMVATFVRFNREVRAADGSLALCSLAPEVQHKLEWARLNRLLAIYASEQEALRGS